MEFDDKEFKLQRDGVTVMDVLKRSLRIKDHPTNSVGHRQGCKKKAIQLSGIARKIRSPALRNYQLRFLQTQSHTLENST